MLRYHLSRLQWRIKRGVLALLHRLLRLRLRWQPARWPSTVRGTVVVLDRCLGIGDVFMISPALRLLLDHGRVTVVAHLPRILDAALAWHVTQSWREHQALVARLVADGQVVLIPFTGLRGVVTLLSWRGRLPPGIIVLNERTWIDTTTGYLGTLPGSSQAALHYSDPPLAAARSLAYGRSAADHPKDIPASVPRLPPLVAPTPTQSALTPTGPFVALAPWATSATRRWPRTHWATLIDLMTARLPDLQLVLLGNECERAEGEAILARSHCSGAVSNLMGKLNLTETAAVLRAAQLLVCCDSGLMHVALGLDTPVLALFGSTDSKTRVPVETDIHSTLADPSLCPRQLAPCYMGLQREPACPSRVECLSLLQAERVATLALERLAEEAVARLRRAQKHEGETANAPHELIFRQGGET